MSEEEKRLRIEATKIAIREWLDEEKKKTQQAIGVLFLNTLAIALTVIGMYFILWAEKHRG